MANLVMSSFQRRIGEKLGVKPGDEMRAAIEEAEANGIEVVLVDRKRPGDPGPHMAFAQFLGEDEAALRIAGGHLRGR